MAMDVETASMVFQIEDEALNETKRVSVVVVVDKRKKKISTFISAGRKSHRDSMLSMEGRWRSSRRSSSDIIVVCDKKKRMNVNVKRLFI